MKKVYKKLIRDNVSGVIKSDKRRPKTRRLGLSEFKQELLKKLVEESKEVAKTKTKDDLIKELADVKEVVSAIQNAYGINNQDVTKRAKNTREKAGSFSKRIFLEYIE